MADGLWLVVVFSRGPAMTARTVESGLSPLVSFHLPPIRFLLAVALLGIFQASMTPKQEMLAYPHRDGMVSYLAHGFKGWDSPGPVDETTVEVKKAHD